MFLRPSEHHIGGHLPGIARLAYSIISAIFFCLAMAVRPAIAASPGGVAGAGLWFAGSGYNGMMWTDQSGSGMVSTPLMAPSGFSSPGLLALDANFNPGASFNGSTQLLRGTASANILGSSNTYIFGVSNWNGNSAGIIANLLADYSAEGSAGLGFYPSPSVYFADSSGNVASGPFTVAQTGATPYILSDCYYPNASLNGATISQNGLSSSPSGASNSISGGPQFELGGRTAGNNTNRVFAGSIDEVIFYQNVTLTANQISQIRSYLAIKYGITMGFNTNSATTTGTNYLSSTGTTVWSGASNATYQFDVAGIAQDMLSGLDQRVSHSVNPVPSPNAVDVTIANGTTISTSSQTSNTAFASDATFVMWGDNNATTSMSMRSGIYRMGRVWRTQTTGAGSTHITVQVPASTFSGITSPAIWVASDANFQTSATYTAMSCGSSNCTVTIPTFSSGSTQYFSFGQPTPVVTTAMSVSPTGAQSPGTTLTYAATFTNNGYVAAHSLTIIDPIPSNTDFKVGSVTTSLASSGLSVTVSYSQDSGNTWTYMPTSGGGGASTGFDRLVTQVRLVFSGTLSYTSPNNVASFSLLVKIQ